MPKETIGFIGLGIMGRPMATHLLKAGHPMVVYNRTPSKMEPLLTLGAAGASSSADVAKRSDIVISMVGDSSDVECVYLGDAGVLREARPGTLLIDMSTIAPTTAVKVAKAAAERACQMLDAPVSGGEIGAQNATLSIMVGGEQTAFERARPVLELLGRPVLCGPSGSGQTVKACNQIQVALNLIGMAEAFALAAKAGIDPAIVLQVLSTGLAQSRAMDLRGPRIIKGDFAPGFRSRLHYKDLNIVRETAHTLGCCLPGAALAHELFGAAQANGWGDLDQSAVIKVIEQLCHVEVRTAS